MLGQVLKCDKSVFLFAASIFITRRSFRMDQFHPMIQSTSFVFLILTIFLFFYYFNYQAALLDYYSSTRRE